MSDRKLSPIAKTLIEARKLIENKDNWCQGKNTQRGSKGQEQFCSRGALYRVTNIAETYSKCHRLLDYHTQKYCAAKNSNVWCVIDSIVHLNDSHSHEDVMAVWDEAIRASVNASMELEVS